MSRVTITDVGIDVRHDELHRLSIEEYHRLILAGGFDEDLRVELLDGLLVDMSPKSPQHENAVRWLTRWLFEHVDLAVHQVGVGAPLTIGRSEPEPDLTVVATPTPLDAHPATALLVIEVSYSSRRRDLQEKPALYAHARVDEYWVLDLDGARAVRHTDPRAGSYRDVSAHGRDATLPGAGVGLPALVVADVLAAAGM